MQNKKLYYRIYEKQQIDNFKFFFDINPLFALYGRIHKLSQVCMHIHTHVNAKNTHTHSLAQNTNDTQPRMYIGLRTYPYTCLHKIFKIVGYIDVTEKYINIGPCVLFVALKVVKVLDNYYITVISCHILLE